MLCFWNFINMYCFNLHCFNCPELQNIRNIVIILNLIFNAAVSVFKIVLTEHLGPALVNLALVAILWSLNIQ